MVDFLLVVREVRKRDTLFMDYEMKKKNSLELTEKIGSYKL